MNIFEIKITNTNDDSDLSTMEYISQQYISQEPDMTADDVMERVGKSLNYQTELEFKCGERFITITACSDDEGYYYNIYASKEAYENDEEPEDGGQCTGTINDALEMALN